MQSQRTVASIPLADREVGLRLEAGIRVPQDLHLAAQQTGPLVHQLVVAKVRCPAGGNCYLLQAGPQCLGCSC